MAKTIHGDACCLWMLLLLLLLSGWIKGTGVGACCCAMLLLTYCLCHGYAMAWMQSRQLALLMDVLLGPCKPLDSPHLAEAKSFSWNIVHVHPHDHCITMVQSVLLSVGGYCADGH